jgi:hypothetical protein
MQRRLGEGDTPPQRGHPADRTHRSTVGSETAQVRYLQLERRMAASLSELGMNGDATGAVEQRGGIAAMDHAERIVDAAIGCADEYRMSASTSTRLTPRFSTIGAPRPLSIMARIC